VDVLPFPAAHWVTADNGRCGYCARTECRGETAACRREKARLAAINVAFALDNAPPAGPAALAHERRVKRYMRIVEAGGRLFEPNPAPPQKAGAA